MSRELGVPLYEILQTGGPIKRYIISIERTIRKLLRKKPRYLFVQNPSVLLALTAIFFGKFMKSVVIVDAHNVGIDFDHGDKIKRKTGQFLNDFIIKAADYVIVTNHKLASKVKMKKGVPLILPDPLPNIVTRNLENLSGKNNVMMVCSYSPDEPYQNVIDAFREIEKSIFLYISGNNKKVSNKIDVPVNVIFTGFVQKDNYYALMSSVDIVIDLTCREDCLVCGAYEAIALNKPLILSRTSVNHDTFKDLAVYTDNSTGEIKNCIISLLDEIRNQKRSNNYKKKCFEADWKHQKDKIVKKIINIQ